MRILQVFNSRIQKHGSFEDFMIQLADKAKSNNLQVGFVFPRINTQEVRERLECLGAKVYTIEDSWKSFAFLKKLVKIVKSYKPDILDFHFCYSANFAIIFLILKIIGIKIIYHYHGEIFPIENLKFANRHFSKLRFQTLFVDKIICVSEANKKFLKALNVNKKIDVVYNGVNVRNFGKEANKTSDFRTKMGFTNGELIVTSIASLIPRKGVDILIRAAKSVIDNAPQARFILIGGGDKTPYQRLAESLGISDKIVFMGLVKDYPYHILKDTDVFAHASYAESFGLSIAESQLIGLPVVATDVGGVPEVVRDGLSGFLVPAGDSDKLARAITSLLNDEKLRKDLGAFGKKWIAERFNLENKVEELIDACIS
jgi:glycosyltransferase involved in cell wall biosynthesis